MDNPRFTGRMGAVAMELTAAMVLVEALGSALSPEERTALAAFLAVALVSGNLLLDTLRMARRANG